MDNLPILTGPALTANYQPPPSQSWASFFYDPNRPIFTQFAVNAMLQDPRVTLGMAHLKGPILSNSRFYVECDNTEAKEFIAAQINRFWRNGADTALSAMEFGYQPCEVIYRSRGGALQYDSLKYIHPQDAVPRTVQGQFCGMDVKNIEGRAEDLYVGRPKVFWAVHNRRRSRWFGDSILRGAFTPWYEKWASRGYRDQRQLWFFKYAFQGPTIYFPKGAEVPTGADGQPIAGTTPIDNKLIAQKMVDAYSVGAGIALPRSQSVSGQPDWELAPPQAQSAPTGLLEYGHDLDDEILEGMEIPPEVVRSGGGSSGGGISIGGQGGRDIPQQAFYSILQGKTQALITDFDEQPLSFLISQRYGPDLDYEIECFGLLDEDTQTGPNSLGGMDPAMAQGGQGQLDENGQPMTMSDRAFQRTQEPSFSGVCIAGKLTRRERMLLRKSSGFSFSYDKRSG